MASVTILGQNFTLKSDDDNDSETKFDKDDEDHYASIRDQQHYPVPA